MSHKSSIPLYWRLKKPKHRLIGTKCKTCENVFFPPRSLCPNCRRGGAVEDFQFSGNGEIISYTTIRTPPEGFEKYSPYAIAIVKLDEGAHISGQIVGDINNVKEGKRVKPVFRRMYEDGHGGIIFYGIKFAIVE